MKLWQLGYRKVESLMGSSLSEQQEDALIAAVAKKSGIILMFDEDDAGRAGREKALARLSRRTFVRVAVLPREGAQPDHLNAEELHARSPDKQAKLMHVHCSTCGEPWDTFHLLTDANQRNQPDWRLGRRLL